MLITDKRKPGLLYLAFPLYLHVANGIELLAIPEAPMRF
jgi:hypothetical protein